VAGVLGAAMAAGRLLGLDRAGLGHALGIASSNAGGLFAFLGGGGDVKRLHAGMAASGGLRAALLAAEGIEGPPAVLEGPDGLAQAFTGGFPTPFAVTPGGRYGIRDCYVKPYPCCRHLQPAAEALFALRAEHAIDAEEIEAIEVATYAIAASHADTAWDTFAGAQLSFPYICALAARDGAITMASFDEVTRADPQLAALAALVEIAVDDVLDATYPANRPARVTIVTPRGSFTRTAMEALGSDQVPLHDDGLRAKFTMLAEPVLGATQASELLDAVWGIEGIDDVRSVLRRTVPK
jgi:2-methylcitrate dehydratase PrpD